MGIPAFIGATNHHTKREYRQTTQSRSSSRPRPHPTCRTRPTGTPTADSTPFTQSHFTPNWLRSIDPHSRRPYSQPDRSPASTSHTRSLVRTKMMENGSGSCSPAVRNGLENHSYIVQIARKSGGCVRSTETAIQALPLRKSAITHAHQPLFLTSVPMRRGAGTRACRVGTHADARPRDYVATAHRRRDESPNS